MLTDEWQPIETALKDGTRMLGSFGAAGVAIFKRNDPGGRYDAWATDEGAACRAPTHWMPLPPPPLEKTNANTGADQCH
jgi:hypothetical protein